MRVCPVSNPSVDKVVLIVGGWLPGPSWGHYCAGCRGATEDKMKYFDLREHVALIGRHVRKAGIPSCLSMWKTTFWSFSDGVCLQFDSRAWGDLLAALVNGEENGGGYDYRDFQDGKCPKILLKEAALVAAPKFNVCKRPKQPEKKKKRHLPEGYFNG